MSVRPLRYAGFTPTEISTLVNEPVVSIHAEETAFLWTLRNRAVDEPHYSLKDLATLDERVEAHLQGICLTPVIGRKYCKANLQNPGAGEVFAFSALAFRSSDVEWMKEALQVGCSSTRQLPGLISALAWIDYATVSPCLSRLLASRHPAHRAVAIAASAAHRKDLGAALSDALEHDDQLLRCRAIKAAGELQRTDLIDQLCAHTRDQDGSCRFWTAWALTMVGYEDGPAALMEWLGGFTRVSRRALRTVLRAVSLEDGRRLTRSLSNEAGQLPSAVMAAGILGDPNAVPWLIRKMEVPELARLAGEAFTIITGVDLSYHDLAQDAPVETGDAETADPDYESNLPWPSPRLVEDWWQKNRQNFGEGVRYLAGRPITAQSATEVLRTGKQRQREAAALELALHFQQALFEVRAPGVRQQVELASWNS
jgi:uncharacterized protein (TIGR02270 family)